MGLKTCTNPNRGQRFTFVEKNQWNGNSQESWYGNRKFERKLWVEEPEIAKIKGSDLRFLANSSNF